jgi:hypothetical protein
LSVAALCIQLLLKRPDRQKKKKIAAAVIRCRRSKSERAMLVLCHHRQRSDGTSGPYSTLEKKEKEKEISPVG